MVGAGDRILLHPDPGGEIAGDEVIASPAGGRRHHQATTWQGPQSVEVRLEPLHLFFAPQHQQELGAGGQGLQRRAAEGLGIGGIQCQRSKGDARKVEPDPLPLGAGLQQAAAGLEAQHLGAGHSPGLPQHMGGRQSAVTTEIHLDRRGKPAQPIVRLPQGSEEGGLRQVELRRHGLQLGIAALGPQYDDGGVAPEGVLAEGIDMKQSGHRQILRGRKGLNIAIFIPQPGSR